jgi:hypothetical protein
MSYPRSSYSAQGHYLGKKDAPKRLETDAVAALALVETALDAAEKRVEYGHNDTCDMELSESEDYPCSCGHDALAAALRAVREGR